MTDTGAKQPGGGKWPMVLKKSDLKMW